MGSSHAKCDICNLKIDRSQMINHQRKCKEEDIRKKTTKKCPKCSLVVPNMEFEDHVFCHSIEEQQQSSNVNNVTINYISNRNNIANQTNFFTNSETNLRDGLNSYVRRNNSSQQSGITPNRSNFENIYNDNSRRNSSNNRFPSIIRSSNLNYNTSERNLIFNDNPEGRISIHNITTLRNLLRNLSESLNDMRINEGDTGVNPEFLSLMPETVVTNVNKLPEEKRNCVICMTQFEKGEKILNIPCCHLYHSECIKDWFKKKNTCPICKFKIDRNAFRDNFS